MSWRSQVWSKVHRDKGRLSQEAGAAMFQGLRIRLTLWYCGVLGVALVLFGVALYFGTQYFLLHLSHRMQPCMLLCIRMNGTQTLRVKPVQRWANKVNSALPARVSRGPSRLRALTRMATCLQVKIPQPSHLLFSLIHW